jgi:phage I-like protein
VSLKVLATCASQPLAVVDGEPLPTEFLIFAPGENPNANNDAKGQPTPVFTARSAKWLQQDAARKGTDYLADLAHSSIDPEAKKARADATDAMAWYQVEVRPDGSCWAVNVRWSAEGERRLRAKLQRYTSPVFFFDAETGEITEFVNVALCSDPATYGNAPLVAASREPVARANARATPAALALCAYVAAKLTRNQKHESRVAQKDSGRHRKR